MREYTFLVPRLTHKERTQLVRIFGGFTAHDVTGGWLDNALVVLEPMVFVTVALEPTRANVDELLQYASQLARGLGQKALY